MQSASPLLLETIRIENGEIYDLPYHQARLDRSRKTLFHTEETLSLSQVIEPPPRGLYRCRILYDTTVHSVEYLPYTPKEIGSLRIVPADIEYACKYADRKAFETLLKENSDVDEIIIEKEGLLTDTTISNVAFFDGEQWVTPAKPLLEGTMRAKLLDEGLLRTAEITKEMLSGYTQVALMNAMIGFRILKHFDIRS